MGDPADDRHSEKDFYKKPGGGLIDPQGEPKEDEPRDDEVAEPTEELPPEGLGKKSAEQDIGKRIPGRVRRRGR